MTTTSTQIHRILTDPAASHWLRCALQTAIARDLVDAAHDAQALADVLTQRMIEHQAGAVLSAPATMEGLKEIKAEWYKQASRSGILGIIADVARVLGNRAVSSYGPKYNYSTPDLEIFVDDYGGYMTVMAAGKLVCSTHPNERLFIPGTWLKAIQTVYPLASGKLTEARAAEYTAAFNRLAKELGLLEG